MSTLTEEQRQRMELNKRKALAIRAAKLAKASLQQSSPVPNNPSGAREFASNTSQFPSTIHSASNSSAPPLQITIVNNSSKQQNNVTQGFYNKTTSINNASAGASSQTNYNNSNQAQKVATSTSTNIGAEPKRITVTCCLISKDRFTLDFVFEKHIVEVLKTLSNKLYDPTNKRWTFPLTEYDKVRTKLQHVQEMVVNFVPLPRYILNVFKANKINTDFRTIDLSPIESTLLSSLYPFQIEGVQFGISKKGRCIIADDMGLGKTIQALGIANYYHSDWPLLIVCPSSMRYQWEQEIINYLPKVPLARIFVMSKSKDQNQIHNPLVLITSYDLMSRCENYLLLQKFGVLIMDESHSIKNMKTQRTKAALKLIAKASRCILLSGTPALSRPVELYPQMKAIEPHGFSLNEFGIRYCNGAQSRFGWDYSGSSNMEELKILLEEKFMIRRLKSTVLDQLPAKIRQVVVLDDELIKKANKEMDALVAKLNNERVTGIERRGTLLQYYAETAKTKLKAIKEYILQILESGNKFLVFAHHKVVLDEVCALLEENRTYFIRIDGAVSSEERKSVCDQFQTEDKFKVAVLSITAASTGLTLTAAHLVIFAELFWNPGILTQAEDRVHRIGQQDSVLVQYLIARKTADDYLWPLVKGKLGVLNEAGLSKDNFSSLETTTMKVESSQKSIMDCFDELNAAEEDLFVDALDQVERKRLKLSE